MMNSNIYRYMKKNLSSTPSPKAENFNSEQEPHFFELGSGSTVLSYKQMRQVLSDLEDPPDGTEGLREILQTINSGYSP